MPRLSLYKPFKGNDYTFMDRTIREQFDIGGTAIHVHKYLGPDATTNSDDPSEPNYGSGLEIDNITGEEINPDGQIDETDIQDLLFMENRDRKYDPDIFDLRGVYSVSDNDFDLTQFGLFLTNDTLFITFHTNDMVERMGRRLMPGDVIELPHLRDELLLTNDRDAINKFYVVQDAARASEGFSQTWYSHIWRVKVAPLTDTQEYADILGTADDPDSLKNKISAYKTEINISNAIVKSSESADPLGLPLIEHLFGTKDASSSYDHGEVLDSGDQFPMGPNDGTYFIRTNVTDITWSDRTFLTSDFTNNLNTTVVDNEEVQERQPLSRVIKPKSDFE